MSNSVRPHRRQPTRPHRPWDSPGKNTGVGCHFLLQCIQVKVKLPSHVWLLATPWTAAYQAPPSMEFSRQEYWSGLPFPPPEDLPNPGIEPASPVFPVFEADSSPLKKPQAGLPWWLRVKASACNVGDLGSIPGLGRYPGELNGNPLQYSCLENPMDGGAWWATVHGVAKSQTRLSDLTNLTSPMNHRGSLYI